MSNTRIPALLALLFLAMLALAMSGCAVQQWCDDNPRSCAVAATVGTLCVAVAAGEIVHTLHKSAVNPAPKFTPYVAAFHAAKATSNMADDIRKVAK